MWDLRNQRRCVERIVDDGALNVTSVAPSPTGGHLAVGSDSGVVNVYDSAGSGGWTGSEGQGVELGSKRMQSMQSAVRRLPVRAVTNLTTAIDNINFNGEAVQAEPMKPVSKAPGMKSLKLRYDKVCSSVAFKFHLRRYTMATDKLWQCHPG